MGKQPVKMRAVVYALSPFQQKIMSGLWKDLPTKITHKISENWISSTLLLTPLVGTYTLRSADMPLAMQERAIRRARALVDANNPGITKPTQVAMCLKKEFDALYGPAWHCIVGKSFGSFVTHAGGGFLYFSVDKLCFLLFKTEVRPLVKPPSLHRLKINNA
ncbi:hypothetical protein CXB51_017839 [Gossypium anomalum]|uniref:Dynein light chain 1, cytoplasmic n=1 Tax=Gossypium anomalum TaxID=47600 RepID=A0A8J5YNK3_9ROSI|nr:hypothetical protein CXB51_017839 [Gossypium anomalum]